MKMKNILQKLLGSLAFLSLLSGCASKSPDAIYLPRLTRSEITSENFKIPVTRQVIDAFVAGQKSFLLYAGSELCSFCLALEPLLENYIKSAKVELFYINTLGKDYDINRQYYFDEFNLYATPTLYIFKEGQVVHQEVGSTHLKTRTAVRKFFQTYTKTGQYYIDEGESIDRPPKYATFTYSFLNPLEQKVIMNTFYPLFENKGFYIYLRQKNETFTAFSLTLGNDETIYPLNGTEDDLLTAKNALISYFS